MTQTETNARFWDAAAAKYARSPIADMASYTYTLERTKSYLGAKDSVLELGAGTSSTALELASGVAKYVATDVSPEMVRIGRQKAVEAQADTLEINVGTPTTEAARAESYDAVLALNLLHLLPSVPIAVAEIARVTAPGGLFISKTGCLASASLPKRILYRTVIAALSLVGKAPQVVHFLKVEELDKLVTEAGFEIIETSLDVGDVPRRYIVARKL